MSDDDLDAEYLALRAERQALQAERQRLHTRPDDREGHQAHRARLAAHIEGCTRTSPR